MKSYIHFLIEAIEQEMDQFKTDITNQLLNKDKTQLNKDKSTFAEDSEKSPDPDVVMYMDKEEESIKKKIEELETQKQNIVKKMQQIEDLIINQTIDTKNVETMKKIENMKKKLTEDVQKFDNLIKIEQDKQKVLQGKKI